MDSTHAVAEMQKRIELLHPEKQEKWTIGCACLISKKSNQNESKELFILTFDEKPKKCYLMLRTVIVEADKDLAAIIDKMKLFQLRQSITIVVRNMGWRYLLIRINIVGMAVQNRRFHGQNWICSVGIQY